MHIPEVVVFQYVCKREDTEPCAMTVGIPLEHGNNNNTAAAAGRCNQPVWLVAVFALQPPRPSPRASHFKCKFVPKRRKNKNSPAK